MNWSGDPQAWSFLLRRFAPRLLLCSLIWELAQLPLYTLWWESSPARIAYAVAHCTLGDLLIGMGALLGALVTMRALELRRWPGAAVLCLMILLTMVYTVASERFNLAGGAWTYAPAMPIVPLLGIGWSPFLQWLLVPLAAWYWARRGLAAAAPL